MAVKHINSKEGWLKEISIYEEGKIEIILKFTSCTKQEGVSNDYDRYDIMMRCEDIVEMPIDGNPRGVNLKSPSFKAVHKTITTNGSKLQDSHLGGDIFANKVEVDYEKKEMKLTFTSLEMGLVNGSTSVAAILYALFMNILVPGNLISFRVRDYKAEKLTNAQRLECVNNAACLNNVVAQKNENLCYQKGYYDDIINSLSKQLKKLFEFKNNYKEEKGVKKYSNNLLLRILEAMDIEKHPTSACCPTKVNDGVGSLVREFYNSCCEMEVESNGEFIKPYTYLLPLLNSFVEFYGFILYHWDDDIKARISRLPEGSPEREELETILYTLSKKTTYNKVNKESQELVANEVLMTSKFITPFNYVFEGDEKYNRKGKIAAESFVWAMFTAFRSNINYNKETNEIGYKVDPHYLWKKCNVKMLREIYTSLTNDCNSAVTGFVKCKPAWSRLYNHVAETIADIQYNED